MAEPSDPKILTLDEIERATITEVAVPALSKRLGGSRTLRVRRVSPMEYTALLPPPPAGWMEWPETEREARERDWLASLTPEVRAARAGALADVHPRLVALAVVEPRLTVEQARGLGDDAITLSVVILRHSDLLPAELDEAPGDAA